MNRAGLTALGCVALALLLAAVPAGTRACGFHSSQTIARTLLNLRYPDALHVDGAVWSAQQKGLLRLDRARLQATGPERRMLDTRAYLEALRALFALGEAFGQTSDAARLPVSLVLTESMLWTRYPADGGVTKASMASYVDNWPLNPWTNADMGPGSDQGDYVYTAGTGLLSFTLVGLGSGGDPIFTVP